MKDRDITLTFTIILVIMVFLNVFVGNLMNYPIQEDVGYQYYQAYPEPQETYEPVPYPVPATPKPTREKEEDKPTQVIIPTDRPKPTNPPPPCDGTNEDNCVPVNW